MKLNDLVCEEWTNRQLFDRLKKLTQSYLNTTDANNTVNGILHALPSARYVGTMYRVVFVSAADMLKCKSNSDVIRMIKQYDSMQAKKYWSFSKTIDQFKQYLGMIQPSDDGITTGDVDVAVIVQQHGVGLDIEAVAAAWASEEDNGSRVMLAARIGEVLATVDQTIRPMMYIVRGITGAGKDYGDGERVYSPKNYRFRPDAFGMMIQAVMDMSQGKTKTPRRRNIHPLSKMRGVHLP